MKRLKIPNCSRPPIPCYVRHNFRIGPAAAGLCFIPTTMSLRTRFFKKTSPYKERFCPWTCTLVTPMYYVIAPHQQSVAGPGGKTRYPSADRIVGGWMNIFPPSLH